MNILSYFSSRNTFLYTRVKVDATVYIYKYTYKPCINLPFGDCA